MPTVRLRHAGPFFVGFRGGDAAITSVISRDSDGKVIGRHRLDDPSERSPGDPGPIRGCEDPRG